MLIIFGHRLGHTSGSMTSGVARVAERVEHQDGTITDPYSVKISRYIQSHTHRGLAIIGQQQPQHYFHRPISVLLNVVLKAGFVADGIQEPVFDGQPAVHALYLDSFKEIAPVLAVRPRRAS